MAIGFETYKKKKRGSEMIMAIHSLLHYGYREKTADVLRELKSKMSLNPEIAAHFPLEVRFAKADEGLISPCHKRDSCFINIVHFR